MGNKKKTKKTENITEAILPETQATEPEDKALADKMDDFSTKVMLAFLAGLSIGAGGVYMVLNNKVEFADRFDALYQCEQVLKDADVAIPEKIDSGAVLNGYLDMYDKYTRFEPDLTDTDQGYSNWVNSMPTAYGMGFTVAFNDDGELYFSTVDPGKPADKQGIKEGDIVIAVDGMKIADDHSYAKKISGKKETQAELLLLRNGELITLTMTRYTEQPLESNSTHTEVMDGALYVYIHDFNTAAFLDEIDDLDYDSVVIDLRGNGGGFDEAAVEMASYFVNSGIVYHRPYSPKQEETTYEVKSDQLKVSLDVPLAILTDSSTASAAEMFEALLIQGRGAVTVGEKTRGKGVSQSLKKFDDGTLYYTDAYFTVGDWECWNGKGIAPDYEVPSGEWDRASAEDEQLKKALELIR